MKESGFLEIQEGCEIKTDEFILRAHKSNKVITNETKYIYIKKGLQIEREDTTKEAAVTQKPTISEFVKTPNEDFGRLIERVEKLKKKEKEEKDREWISGLTRRDSYQMYFSATSVTIIIGVCAAGAMWAWKRFNAINIIEERAGPANNMVQRRLLA